MSAIHRGWHCGLFGCLAAVTLGANTAFGQACPGNVNGDGNINAVDLAMVLAAWGPCGSGDCPADVDGDGFVGGNDLTALLSAWGPCPIVPSWATVIEGRPDPAVVTDAGLRAAITASGYAWRVKDTATQIEMLLVPPGTFMMGCTEPALQFPCTGNEFPVHQVTLTQPFYMGRYEVTQAQFVARMGYNPSEFQGFPDSPQRPVEYLDIHQMRQFMGTNGMRLPTEAEWEYACRAGTTTAYHNGSNDYATLGDIAWHAANSGSMTHSVGLKSSNRFGLHDMLGNVWELIEGCPDPYPAAPTVDPIDPPCPPGPPNPFTILRGGSWFGPGGTTNSSASRASSRVQTLPGAFGSTLGLRVARNP